MSNPSISIIIPSFNQADFLAETFRSMEGQQYDSLELIVMDGGSTDHSVEIIRSYEHLIASWVSEKDEGQTDAIQKGFEKITGEIVTWINSDDLLEPGALKIVSQLFADKNIDAVCGRTRLFGNGRNQLIEPSFRNESVHHALSRFAFNQQGTFYRSEAIRKAGHLNPALHFVMDKDWWNRFLVSTTPDRIRSTEHTLAAFRIHGDSKTGGSLKGFYQEYASLLVRLSEKFGLHHEVFEILKDRYTGTKYYQPTMDVDLYNNEIINHLKDMAMSFLLRNHSKIYVREDFEMAKRIKRALHVDDYDLDKEHQTYAENLSEKIQVGGWLRFKAERKIGIRRS